MLNASGRPGPKVQTNRLRSSISYEVKNYEEATVGTNVFYAPFVEFGHKQTPGQFVPPLGVCLVKDSAPAYPFLGPVPGQVKDQLEGVFVSFGNDLKDTWTK
jgi:phage gpG-like protein